MIFCKCYRMKCDTWRDELKIIDKKTVNQTDKPDSKIQGGNMQVCSSIAVPRKQSTQAQKADPRGYDASKPSLGRGLSTLTHSPTVLHLLGSHLHSTRPITTDRHSRSQSLQPSTGSRKRAQPFLPPALHRVPNIRKPEMHERTPLLNSALPQHPTVLHSLPQPDQDCLLLSVSTVV